MAKATIQISFAEVDAQKTILLTIDDVLNESQTFQPGDEAFLRVERNPLDAYQMLTSGGSITKVGTAQSRSFEQTLKFALESTKSLTHFPISAVTYEWIGDDPGVTPVFNLRKVEVSSDIVAVLKCTYQWAGDNWSLTFNVAGEVVVVALMDDLKASQTVDFSGEAEFVDYDLEVYDYCTDEPVVGATVFLDSSPIGSTDTNGKVQLGLLQRGTTHDIKVTKSGYIDSDVDVLRNDEFTVP